MKTVSLYENSLTNEYFQKLPLIKIAWLEIFRVTLIGIVGTQALLETDKMQNSN